jgi:hypothetical protein
MCNTSTEMRDTCTKMRDTSTKSVDIWRISAEKCAIHLHL